MASVEILRNAKDVLLRTAGATGVSLDVLQREVVAGWEGRKIFRRCGAEDAER